MTPTAATDADRALMIRCFELAIASAQAGEYPYGVVIAKRDLVVTESTNRVARDRDVTRHAEVTAISDAQKRLGSTHLEDCALYASAEPCAFCCYAIRESRISKVAYGLKAPVTGGSSRWNILEDEMLSKKIPEVFAPPPIVLHCFMCEQAEAALRHAAPFASWFIEGRGLFIRGRERVSVPGTDYHSEGVASVLPKRSSFRDGFMRLARSHFFDRFGRGTM